MLEGSCCCKKVQFKVTEAPTAMGTCHCSRCRKVGASTIVFVKKGSVEITSGKELIGTYHPEEGYKYKRNFCTFCGSSLGEIISEEDSFPIPANLFDSDLNLKNQFNEHIDDKPSWV